MNNLKDVDLSAKRKISNNLLGGKIIMLKKMYVEVQSSSRIVIAPRKTFYCNCAWTKKSYFPSLLSMGKNATLSVHDNFKMYDGAKIFIADGALLELGGGYINNNVQINCFNKIEIGKDVAFGENICIRDSDNHLVNNQNWDHFTQPVKIGNKVWIGMNVTILKGVIIADGAVIGANSVVTSNIPAFSLAVGNPARVIKNNITWQ